MIPIRAIFLALLALDLAGVGALWYGSVAIQKMKNEEVVLMQELLSEDQEKQRAVGLRKVLASTEANRKVLAQYIFKPTDEDQIRFITNIEQFGTSTSGAVIETVGLNSAKPGILSGDFSIKGSWAQVYHAIRLIEEFPARVVITKIETREDGSGQWSGTIKLDLLSLQNKTK